LYVSVVVIGRNALTTAVYVHVITVGQNKFWKDYLIVSLISCPYASCVL